MPTGLLMNPRSWNLGGIGGGVSNSVLAVRLRTGLRKSCDSSHQGRGSPQSGLPNWLSAGESLPPTDRPRRRRCGTRSGRTSGSGGSKGCPFGSSNIATERSVWPSLKDGRRGWRIPRVRHRADAPGELENAVAACSPMNRTLCVSWGGATKGGVYPFPHPSEDWWRYRQRASGNCSGKATLVSTNAGHQGQR